MATLDGYIRQILETVIPWQTWERIVSPAGEWKYGSDEHIHSTHSLNEDEEVELYPK